MSTTLVDQCIVDWYESQSEETLCDLRDRFDADTPRKAWIAFFADCPTPATKQPCESLAAPAAAGQGEGTHSYLWTNAPQWQAIAYFLSGFRPCTSPASIACEADAPVHVAHVSKPATAQ